MNCKPGDVARYVGPIDEIRGMVVIVVEADPIFPGAWLHEPPLPTRTGHSPFSTWDKNLRPIRDSDGTDETLTWSPREVTA